jgi:hypothetical protein
MTVIAQELDKPQYIEQFVLALLRVKRSNFVLQVEHALSVLGLRGQVEWLLVDIVQRLNLIIFEVEAALYEELLVPRFFSLLLDEVVYR